MRRFVRSDIGVILTLGAIGGVLIGATHASGGAAYLITFVLGAIVYGITLAPEQIRLWRETHGTRSSRRRKRTGAVGE
jgi:hypothetical protein